MKHLLFIASLFVFQQSQAQLSETRLENHVYFLADDSLEGRMTGSEGEKIAYTYIINKMTEIGVGPFPNTNSFLNSFSYRKGKSYGEKNQCKINTTLLLLDEDYYPLAYSGNALMEGKGLYLNYGLEKDYKKNISGQIIIIESSVPRSIDPHSEEYEQASLRSRISMAIKKGAAAVVVINSFDGEMNPEKEYQKNIFPFEVPVIFVKDHISKEINLKKKAMFSISTDLIQEYGEGNNVIGFIENPGEKVVVIGAHYDHLGWGIEGSSRYKGDPAIHNGADDNASGVSMMIELAREIYGADLHYDYCFIAFSGEELGLYGSKSLFDDSIMIPEKINYMINMDMVGRLDPDLKELAINGTGTSSRWSEELKKLELGDIELKTKESGNGPSDHASFYFNNIPVLHFFTGTHQDYHHPADDAEKVNYKGMADIGNAILSLVSSLDSVTPLDYIKTKDEEIEAPRFTVTLGVMPDYMFDGKGMRIDGVTDGKPAAVAGLQKGDIVIKLGDVEVLDMMTYMEGLSRFRVGDSTKVWIDRAGESIEFNITF